MDENPYRAPEEQQPAPTRRARDWALIVAVVITFAVAVAVNAYYLLRDERPPRWTRFVTVLTVAALLAAVRLWQNRTTRS